MSFDPLVYAAGEDEKLLQCGVNEAPLGWTLESVEITSTTRNGKLPHGVSLLNVVSVGGDVTAILHIDKGVHRPAGLKVNLRCGPQPEPIYVTLEV